MAGNTKTEASYENGIRSEVRNGSAKIGINLKVGFYSVGKSDIEVLLRPFNSLVARVTKNFHKSGEPWADLIAQHQCIYGTGLIQVILQQHSQISIQYQFFGKILLQAQTQVCLGSRTGIRNYSPSDMAEHRYQWTFTLTVKPTNLGSNQRRAEVDIARNFIKPGTPDALHQTQFHLIAKSVPQKRGVIGEYFSLIKRNRSVGMEKRKNSFFVLKPCFNLKISFGYYGDRLSTTGSVGNHLRVCTFLGN